MAPCQSSARASSWSRICWKLVLLTARSAGAAEPSRLAAETAEIRGDAENLGSNLPSSSSFKHRTESGLEGLCRPRRFLCCLCPIAFTFPDAARAVARNVLLLPETFIGWFGIFHHGYPSHGLMGENFL